jgi:hypothetical protein
MNQEPFIQDTSTLEQLELFDIVPDRPLPVPRFRDDPDDEPHMEWLRGRTEDELRILVQILGNTPGFRRP